MGLNDRTESVTGRATHPVAAMVGAGDPTTGLASGAEMLDRLRRIFDDAGARSVAVLLGGIDVVGATPQPGPRDAEMLVAVAGRLRDSVGSRGLVARLDGDEFAAVLMNPAPGESVAIARRLVESIREPVFLRRGSVELGLSVGVALGRVDHDRPEALLHDADVALSRAKAAGPRRVAVYDVGLRTGTLGRREIAAGLRNAASGDELWIAYQPRVRLSDGRVVAVEALLRWNHPTEGLLAPGDFLSVAEEGGMMAPLGAWVLETACAQLAGWRAASRAAADLIVGVNISAQELQGGSLEREVVKVLAQTGIPADRLELEVSQRALTGEAAAERVRGLKRLGVRVAVDDFGTGYAWLAELRRLPVDVLKVDGLVVQGLHRAQADRDLVRLAAALAATLGVEAVAEGVEIPETLATLRGLGYGSAQGSALAPPMAAGEISALLAAGGHVATH